MKAQVPFRLVGGAQPLILVPVKVNGDGPHWFILDTGAGHCLLTPELAQRLGVSARETRQGRGAAGHASVGIGSVDSLAVGGMTSGKLDVGITDELHRIAAVVRAPIDGDLGFPFLQHFRVQLDYRSQVLTLEDGDDASAGGSLPVEFTLASPHKPLILLPVFVNGKGPFRFAVDTGTSMTCVSTTLAGRLGLRLDAGTDLTGVGGTFSSATGRLESLSIGDSRATGLTIASGGFIEQLGRAVGCEFDGIVGYDFLKQYRPVIDYPRRTLQLAGAPAGAYRSSSENGLVNFTTMKPLSCPMNQRWFSPLKVLKRMFDPTRSVVRSFPP
jgi:predicted aspartyl protease